MKALYRCKILSLLHMDIVNLEDKVIPFMKRQNGPGESEGEWLKSRGTAVYQLFDLLKKY